MKESNPMKLCTTTKNERGGKKSTCDNTRILVELSYGNKLVGIVGLYSIIDDKKEGYRIVWVHTDKGFTTDNVLREEVKGKKKKGECEHFIVKDDHGKEYCQECGTYNNLQ